MRVINQGKSLFACNDAKGECGSGAHNRSKVFTSQDVLELGLKLAQTHNASTAASGASADLWIGKYLLAYSCSPSDTRLVLGQITELINFLNADFCQILSVKQLACLLGYSRSHFTRLFKNSFGVPPATFLVYRRLEQACWAMGNTHSRLTDIALQFGFCDQSHFCRSFKREVGLSPNAWRSGQSGPQPG